MKTSRITIVQNQIIELFNRYPISAFSSDDLYKILQECRKAPIKLPQRFSLESFIKFLIDTKSLQTHYIRFPVFPNDYLRYTWGKSTVLELCSSIRNKSYFTHKTAMYIHELIKKEPKEIYINVEQSAKFNPEGSTLSQTNIDAAFSRPQRSTTNVGSIIDPAQDYKIFMLNGKQTRQLGVIEIDTPFGKKLPVTNIERTLIDIIVRTTYSGGINEIVKAYRLAKNKFSIKNLVDILKRLSYIYPYHQAIGFLLEKTGNYENKDLKLLKTFGLKYDFYLEREMTKRAYSKEWRLYYPKLLKI